MTAISRKRTYSTMIKSLEETTESLVNQGLDDARMFSAMQTTIKVLEKSVEHLEDITDDLYLYKEEVDKLHYGFIDLNDKIDRNTVSSGLEYQVEVLEEKVEELEEKIEVQGKKLKIQEIEIEKLKTQFFTLIEWKKTIETNSTN